MLMHCIIIRDVNKTVGQQCVMHGRVLVLTLLINELCDMIDYVIIRQMLVFDLIGYANCSQI